MEWVIVFILICSAEFANKKTHNKKKKEKIILAIQFIAIQFTSSSIYRLKCISVAYSVKKSSQHWINDFTPDEM